MDPAPAPAPIAPFRVPDQLNICNGNVPENFRRWKRQMEIYMAASGVSGRPDDVQIAVILHCAGPNVVEVFDQFTWENATDKDDPKKVLEKFENYCNPRSNEVIESHRFWCLQYTEPFDLFLTELRNRADRCNFDGSKDRLIRDKIIFSVQGKLQEQLLKDDTNTLEKTIKVCRAFEQSMKHAKEIRDGGTGNVNVNKVGRASGKPKTYNNSSGRKPDSQKPRPSGRDKGKQKSRITDCEFCGNTHEADKLKCPAYGKTCSHCHGRNHFKRKCKKIYSVELCDETDGEDDKCYWLKAVKRDHQQIVTAVLTVNDVCVRFQLDTAADINTICQKYVRENQVRPTSVKLKMWDKTDFKPLGEVTLDVTNERTGKTEADDFFVVQNGLMCLLGLKTIQKMNFVKVNNDMFISNVNAVNYLGDLGEASLKVDPNIEPKILPCRNIPISIQDDVKREIELLVSRNILVPVAEPTRWVSQMAVARKSNGKLRICIDPQTLNSALLREHFRLTTLDDVLPKLSKARLFSNLDVKEAYWHVRLDEASSLLTTMITPFGRFRWARLPFGLKVSSEIFQGKLHEAIGDLDGIFSIADDILVAGCGETDRIAQQDNDAKLRVLYKRCSERKIILNDDKKEVGLREISFHGHKITHGGVKMDEKKVRSILEMSPPEDVGAVKRFCGVVQYMSKYLPDLASLLEPIRALTRKDVVWKWSDECASAFGTIKQKLTTAPVLSYFNPNKPVVVEVDSSQFGLGAVLLQDGKPVEYASRLLTSSERNWAQIEKECLAILFGLERFDQYTYGRKVVIENDHKPLASIFKKPLSSAPKRLQDIMLRLGRYDFEFQFIKGTSLILADALSRAGFASDLEDRPRILYVDAYTNIPDARLDEVRIATAADSDMKNSISYILNGWPEKKSQIPEPISQYFDFRDVLGYQDGIIVKGEAVVIPESLRGDMKARLHKSHLATESMLRRAKGVIFWPGISNDIRKIANGCEICQANKPNNCRETLKQHDEGGPWDKIGVDICEINSRQYLVTVDYYSNFIEVDLLTTTTSNKVISCLKKLFARLGIPKTIMSHGGPQFSSREFSKFAKLWGINHVMSSPHYPKSNGKAESAVKIVKNIILKCLQDNSDQYEALLEQRNTPRQDTGLSPSEMLFGRKSRTMLPLIQPLALQHLVMKYLVSELKDGQ